MLEQRDDVGERLVEGQHVRVGRLHEVLVQAVEQRVRRLVRDDVVRQAGEDHAAGELAGGAIVGGRKVAEEQARPCCGCSRRWPPQRVRVDAQPLHELVGAVDAAVALEPIGPEGLAPERPLEAVDGRHRHRVDHLLVELRVALRRREAVLRQHVG